MAEDTISDVIEFLNRIRSEDEVTIRFKKEDGTTRIMKCTLKFDKIPKQDRPKDVNLPKILKLLNISKILHVYDLEKHGWRSVPFKRAEWLETPDKRRFRIKGK